MKSNLLLALCSASSLVAALGQEPVVSLQGSDGDFQIAGGPISAGQILVSDNDYWGVIRAAGDLAADFGRVTGANYTLSTGTRTSNSTYINGTSSASAAVYSFNPVNNKNNTVVSFHSVVDPKMQAPSLSITHSIPPLSPSNLRDRLTLTQICRLSSSLLAPLGTVL